MAKYIAIIDVDETNEHIKENGFCGEMGWVAESGITLEGYTDNEDVVDAVTKLINETLV